MSLVRSESPVQWSDLCNTDSAVALAYYSSRTYSAIGDIFSKTDGSVLPEICDVVRSVAGRVDGGWGKVGGDAGGCAGGSGGPIECFCGRSCLGFGPRRESGGSFFGSGSSGLCGLGDRTICDGAGVGTTFVGPCDQGASQAVRRDDVVCEERVDTTTVVRDGVDGGSDVGSSSAGESVARGAQVGLEGLGLSGGPVRGRNWARNQRKRELKKMKSQGVEGLSSVPEWRRGAGTVVAGSAGVVGRQGYFSDLSGEVQRELKESRARALIAENNRRAAVEASKLRDMTGLKGAMADFARTAETARRLQKVSGGELVGGWAKTLATLVQESVAAAVSEENGSVPTLEEISAKLAVTGSGSEPAGGSDREVEYRIRKRLLDDAYEEMEVWNPYDKEDAFASLEREFADLFKTPEELKEMKMAEWSELAVMVGLTESQMSVLSPVVGRF